jgi:glycosyltransferase involved in cell wall biosynthesis
VSESTFVKKDIAILSRNYKVLAFDFEVASTAKWKIIIRFLLQLIFLFRFGFNSYAFVCQFAGYHSFLPALFSKLFGKKTLIVVGGMDAVAFPSIRYGNFQKKFLKNFTKWSYKLCTHIAPKHVSLWLTEYNYVNDDHKFQGIKYFMPQLEKPYTVITNGYDGNKFRNITSGKKNIFLTVTGAMEYSFQTKLKGIDLILEVAPFFPDYEFKIVGALSEDQFPAKSANVTVLTKINNDKLIELYSESKFYLQLSMAEGFPNALCEAMLCECVPVGSAVFSIPEIINDTGFILKQRNLEMLKTLLKDVMESDIKRLGKSARERILNNFSLNLRENKLHLLMEKL